MAKKRFAAAQIIHNRNEAEMIVAESKRVTEACRQIGVVEYTFHI